MKIAFSSTLYGGLNTYVLEAGRWLSHNGHTVHVIYLGREVPPKDDRYKELHFHVYPSGNLHYYLARLGLSRTSIPALVRLYEQSRAMAAALKQIEATGGLDLAELHEGFSFPRLFQGHPYVCKMHGAEWTFRHYCQDGPYSQWMVNHEARFLKGARHIYAISRSHAEFIMGACRIPPSQIHLIRLPSDLSEFRDREPPTQGPPFCLMAVGRLQRRKGTETLIRAMRRVWETEPECHLHLYGAEGDFGKAQIEALIPAHEHQGRIHCEGFLPRGLLIERYQQAHVYLAPTRYEVSGGMHIQEALACGRPVIASDIGPVPELVHHNETGWLVPRDDHAALAEAIIFSLRHPELREKFGRAARTFVQRFDKDSIMSRQIQLYLQALSQ